jgi:hypothetical protein
MRDENCSPPLLRMRVHKRRAHRVHAVHERVALLRVPQQRATHQLAVSLDAQQAHHLTTTQQLRIATLGLGTGRQKIALER